PVLIAAAHAGLGARGNPEDPSGYTGPVARNAVVGASRDAGERPARRTALSGNDPGPLREVMGVPDDEAIGSALVIKPPDAPARFRRLLRPVELLTQVPS